MPMPHRTFAEVAKRRLVGKEGSERVATIRALMEELPGYRNGPYADLRKWLEGELERTRVRGKVLHRDSIQVRREGAAQIASWGRRTPASPRCCRRCRRSRSRRATTPSRRSGPCRR